MTTKTITIMEDAYDLLARAKLPDESFSDTIRRTLNAKKGDLTPFFGRWEKGTAEEAEKAMRESRKGWNERLARIDP
jgi:predicted CopG family antitoxin